MNIVCYIKGLISNYEGDRNILFSSLEDRFTKVSVIKNITKSVINSIAFTEKITDLGGIHHEKMAKVVSEIFKNEDLFFIQNKI